MVTKIVISECISRRGQIVRMFQLHVSKENCSSCQICTVLADACNIASLNGGGGTWQCEFQGGKNGT